MKDAELISRLKISYDDKVKSLKIGQQQQESIDSYSPPEKQRNSTDSMLDSEASGKESMEMVQLDGGIPDDEAAKQARAFAAKLGEINMNESQNGEAGGVGTSQFRKRRLTTTIASQCSTDSNSPTKSVDGRKSSAVLYHAKEIHSPGSSDELPFPETAMGMHSCHGLEPSMYDLEGITAKINQDRGCVVFPFANDESQVLFAVLDGHGEHGSLVSQYTMITLISQLEVHPDLKNNPSKALKDTFLSVDESLRVKYGAEAEFSGTTVVAALIRDGHIWVANVGDSRIVIAKHVLDGELNKSYFNAKDLSIDHNPNSPGEEKRILEMGGYISLPPEPGLSARVWLDPGMTQAGLAMARSIGDHAVKAIGVIAEPEITEYDILPEDKFIILASDGVWEFLSSQDAVDIVQKSIGINIILTPNLREYVCIYNGGIISRIYSEIAPPPISHNSHSITLDKGKSCKIATRALIEFASTRWGEEEGDYRYGDGRSID